MALRTAVGVAYQKPYYLESPSIGGCPQIRVYAMPMNPNPILDLALTTGAPRHTARHSLGPRKKPSFASLLSDDARIPVSAPPPPHAISTPLLILRPRHAHARKFLRLRERSHSAPRVQRWISGAHDPERHLRREDRPQRRVEAIRETRHSRGRTR